MSIRVRFAPSPTGLLHVGALRTALYDFLLARKHGGVNILRIEDTDRSRYDPDSEAEFIESLRWVGIEYDEGPHVGGPFEPYRQSERKAKGIYAREIQKLLVAGHAYKAFDTPEDLEEMRELQQVNKQPTGYFGGSWRDADPMRVAAAEKEHITYVIRQRVPRGRKIVVQDAIRGPIEFESDTLPDPVLIKADGMPTYHFAAMVDDRLMEITHVLRGEEWISSAPNHVLLFEQFGWQAPVLVHCPVIVGNDGKKLSKRHGATRVLDYAAQGYLKQPLKNFLALIGWSPGDEREAMSERELIEAFAIDGIQPSPGRFDMEKLKWLNGHAIRQMEPDTLLDALLEYIRAPHTRQFWESFTDMDALPNAPKLNGKEVLAKLDQLATAAEGDRSYVLAALKLEQERVRTLAEFGEACAFFFEDEPLMDAKAVEKWLRVPHANELFDFLIEQFEPQAQLDAAQCETAIRAFAEQNGFEKLGPVVHPTRVALTGKTAGPSLFDLMAVLGPERMIHRLRRAKRI